MHCQNILKPQKLTTNTKKIIVAKLFSTIKHLFISITNFPRARTTAGQITLLLLKKNRLQ